MEQQESAVTVPAGISLEDFIESVTRGVLRAMNAREIQTTAGGVQTASPAQAAAYIVSRPIVIGIHFDPSAV